MTISINFILGIREEVENEVKKLRPSSSERDEKLCDEEEPNKKALRLI